MTSIRAALQEVDRLLAEATTSGGPGPREEALGGASGSDDASGLDGAGLDQVRDATDGELIELLQLAGRLQRRLDGLITEVSAQVIDRDLRPRSERFTARVGCHDTAEVLRRTLLVDRHTAQRYLRAARGVRREQDITSGALLPPTYPGLAELLRGGVISVTGFLACTTPLEAPRSRIGRGDILEADGVLARVAAGLDIDGGDEEPDASADKSDADGDEADRDEADGDDGGRPAHPAPTTDELKALAEHIAALLDPDGAEPVDEVAQRRRHLTIGVLRDGLVPIRGALLPDVAGQLQRILDSILNPRLDGADPAAESRVAFEPAPEAGISTEEDFERPPDQRTGAQKRHDALATALTVAAASGSLPTLGGAAPTLVVGVTAEDYARGEGRATVEGLEYQVPLAVAHQTACAGSVQRVLFDEGGAIVALGTSGRIFNAHQRRAIALRDRNCVIPGCDVRAEWCEIHHVAEHSRGGPTHTGNGVLLCWHHHRTLDISGWEIRMREGSPEIRGPAWWDPARRWRRPRARPRELELQASG